MQKNKLKPHLLTQTEDTKLRIVWIPRLNRGMTVECGASG